MDTEIVDQKAKVKTLSEKLLNAEEDLKKKQLELTEVKSERDRLKETLLRSETLASEQQKTKSLM